MFIHTLHGSSSKGSLHSPPYGRHGPKIPQVVPKMETAKQGAHGMGAQAAGHQHHLLLAQIETLIKNPNENSRPHTVFNKLIILLCRGSLTMFPQA